MIEVKRDDGTVGELTPGQYAAEFGALALQRAMGIIPRDEMTSEQTSLADRMQSEAETSAELRARGVSVFEL